MLLIRQISSNQGLLDDEGNQRMDVNHPYNYESDAHPGQVLCVRVINPDDEDEERWYAVASESVPKNGEIVYMDCGDYGIVVETRWEKIEDTFRMYGIGMYSKHVWHIVSRPWHETKETVYQIVSIVNLDDNKIHRVEWRGKEKPEVGQKVMIDLRTREYETSSAGIVYKVELLFKTGQEIERMQLDYKLEGFAKEINGKDIEDNEEDLSEIPFQ
jgi:hypothetical protein